jgi:predicted HTH domain antitoxin
MFLLAYTMLAKGRTEFTADERAQLELSRYRCFLLGLPEDLLADTPQGIVDLMNARSGTLRRGFDDATCGELLRATMAADLKDGDGLGARIYEKFERAFSKLFFLKSFMGGDKRKSAAIGVTVTAKDMALALAVALLVHGRIAFYDVASKIPVVRDWADRRLVNKIRKQLQSYGHADFTTDAEQYRPAKGVAKAA